MAHLSFAEDLAFVVPGVVLEKRHIPWSVWALGFMSMFMDISAEMIHSLLPAFVQFMRLCLGALLLVLLFDNGPAAANTKSATTS